MVKLNIQGAQIKNTSSLASHGYSPDAAATLRPIVLVLLSLLLRLRFMLLVALVRAMLGARRTNDSMRLASRDDRLGTLALELIGAPAASRELTERRAPVPGPSGLWDTAALPDESETELTSGELTLTGPTEMAVDSLLGSALSPDAEPPSAVERTTSGSCPSVPVGPPPSSVLCSDRPSSLRAEPRPTSLHAELLLPLRPEDVEDGPPLSGQLFLARLLQGVGGPATAQETVLGDGANSGSYPGANFRSNFPSAPMR